MLAAPAAHNPPGTLPALQINSRLLGGHTSQPFLCHVPPSKPGFCHNLLPLIPWQARSPSAHLSLSQPLPGVSFCSAFAWKVPVSLRFVSDIPSSRKPPLTPQAWVGCLLWGPIAPLTLSVYSSVSPAHLKVFESRDNAYLVYYCKPNTWHSA